jgi:hypothetical protein
MVDRRVPVHEGRRDVVKGKTIVFVPITKSSTAWSPQKPTPIRARAASRRDK